MSLRARVALLGSLVLIALAGCGRTPQAGRAAAGPSRHPAAGVKEVEIQEDPVKTGVETGDAILASRVRTRFAADPRLRQLPIEVDAEAGRVTLWGHVGSAEERAAAAEVARRSPGVTSVINLIKVGG